MSKRFTYDYKTGRMKDTESKSQATSNMRVLETQINDACTGYEKRIKELDKENEQLKKEIIAIEKRADKVYDENEQLKSFIQKLQNSDGNIVLINGQGYTKSYIERLLE